MRLLQINVSANWGSHGKIAEAIGKLVIKNGGESTIAFGRYYNQSKSNLIHIGGESDIKFHGVATRLFDRHGLESIKVTKDFIHEAEKYNPDIIHLHNIHGYYLNYPLLFEWLKRLEKPIVWTLHDCWSYTGHCAYYTYNQCEKWQSGCNKCPGLDSYPKSFFDGSKRNYKKKMESFLGLDKLVLVPVSEWLAKDLKKSFLRNYHIEVIHNGINLDVFKPSLDKGIISTLGAGERKILLGVASVWEKRKGLEEFIKLREILSDEYVIVLVGLTEKQKNKLPNGIIGITRTNNQEELVNLYSSADVFVNPTLEDNFPTTNLESLACGTPVVTYKTGGSPEAIDGNTGIVVPYKNIKSLKEAVINVCQTKRFSLESCRQRAILYFNQDLVFAKYISLYNNLLNQL